MKICRIFIIFFIAVSCVSLSQAKTNTSVLLENIWVFGSYNIQTENSSFVKKKRFSKKARGFQFLPNGKLKVKQNVSWCGTEPIEYEIVDGTWEKISDSIVIMKYLRIGKENIEKIQIIELDKDRLVIKTLYN